MPKRGSRKPYALSDGEGRSYRWHDVLFTIKAAAAETGGAFALWDVTTRPGEEPHKHVHDDVDEIFYVLKGSITFHVGGQDFHLKRHGFAYVPLGTPHTYTIHSKEVRMLGISAPSDFGDNIERTGKPFKARGRSRGTRQGEPFLGSAIGSNRSGKRT
jgi:mannose-6-phosphate isomerase-like protein (cupin superfamily)